MASLETTRGLDARTISRIRKNPQQALDIINNLNVPSRIDYRAQEDNVQYTAPQPRQLNVPTDIYNTAPATRKRRNINGGYTIQKGDTLSAIAKRYGTTVQAIAEANGIEDVNRIYVGDNLTIPSSNNTKSTSSSTQRQTARPATTRSNNNDNYVPTTGKTLPEFTVNDNNNNIYSATRDLPEVNVISNRMSNDDMIKARYQRQINNQRARDEYYRNQRMAQGRRAEQIVAARPNYKGLETFANVAAAAPGFLLAGEAALPYVVKGSQAISNGRNWIEAGNRIAEGTKNIGTRIERNAIARDNVRGIKEANRLMEEPARPINGRRTMRKVRQLRNAIARDNVKGIKQANKAAKQAERKSLTTAKPKSESIQGKINRVKGKIYQRTHTRQAYDNPNIQPYGQYNSQVGPQPKPKVSAKSARQRTSQSKPGAKKRK